MSRAAAALLMLLAAAPAFAQSPPAPLRGSGATGPIYVPFTPGSVKGVLYKPDSGPAPHVAVLLIHRTSNFLAHLATTELASRGFMVLAMNPRSDNNEAAVSFEDNALDIKSGIEFLRRQPGITRVLLFGHSGGGPATSFYQAVAETGPSYCQGPNKIVECSNTLAGLPKADGLILVDAHPGVSVNGLRSLNAALLDEKRSAQDRSRARSVQPGQRLRPEGPALFRRVQAEVFQGAGRSHEPADRRGAPAPRRDESRRRRLSRR